jgi:hypothetical protein
MCIENDITSAPNCMTRAVLTDTHNGFADLTSGTNYLNLTSPAGTLFFRLKAQ